MIERIVIKNFKSIHNLTLDLKPLNILIGSNGVGKSNFITFLKLVNKINEQKLQSYIASMGGIDNLLYFGLKHSFEIYGLLDFNNTNAYFFQIEPSQDNNVSLTDGDYFNGINDKTKNYLTWHNMYWTSYEQESVINKTKSSRSKYILNYLNSFKIYHFHDTSRTAKIKQTCPINDNIYLREDASNLAAFLYLLQEKYPKILNKIEALIKSIAPFFDRFKLLPNRLNEELIQLEWQEKDSDMYFNAHNLSDGTLRMMALTTLLLQPNLPKTIIIDEPELGLHPAAIEKLAHLLKQASRESQIIVSTQSVNLLSHFLPEDVIVVDREKNQSIFQRLKSEELNIWLEDYSLGEIWEKNIIRGRP